MAACSIPIDIFGGAIIPGRTRKWTHSPPPAATGRTPSNRAERLSKGVFCRNIVCRRNRVNGRDIQQAAKKLLDSLGQTRIKFATHKKYRIRRPASYG